MNVDEVRDLLSVMGMLEHLGMRSAGGASRDLSPHRPRSNIVANLADKVVTQLSQLTPHQRGSHGATRHKTPGQGIARWNTVGIERT